MKNEPITLRQAAEQLGTTYQQLWYAVATHKVETRRLGRERYFLQEDLPKIRQAMDK